MAGVNNAGSTVTGNSKAGISDTSATTSSLPFRIVELVEETKNSSGGFTEALVKWNAGHAFANTNWYLRRLEKWLFQERNYLKNSFRASMPYLDWSMQNMEKNTLRFMKLKPQIVLLKKKPSCQDSLRHLLRNEGSAIEYDNAQEAFTARYTHETIAMGFSLTEEAIEDNLYDSLSARYTKALARAMAYTKQVKAAAILNNAF